MELINKIKKIPSKTWIKIVLISIFLMMLVLNLLTPLIADDYSYSFIFGTNKRIHNILDVFNSQAIHYMTWGGRSISHFIAQVFLMMPKVIFSICNSIVYTIVVYLIYKIISDKERPLLVLLIHLLLYFCLPVFGQNCIWLIGSCNYLWTTMFILLFILLFKKKRKDNLLSIILMFILGFIAGWSNENSSFALIVITFLTILVTRKDKINKWKISGLIGNIVGFLVMILAPGNYVRNAGIVDDMPFFNKILDRTITYTGNIVRFMLPLIILAIVLVTIYVYKKKKINKSVFIFFIGSFFAVYSMLLSPQFPERSWLSPVLFLVIGNMILINDLYDVHKIFKFLLIDSILILTVIYIGDYGILSRDINILRKTWAARIEEINNIKNEKNTNLEFDAYYSTNWKNPNFGLVDLTSEVDEWPDKDISAYYGIDSISSKPTE